jgi:hypothetical protein
MWSLILVVSILGGGSANAPGVAISRISTYTDQAACNRASNGAQANGVKSFVAPATGGQAPNVQFQFLCIPLSSNESANQRTPR